MEQRDISLLQRKLAMETQKEDDETSLGSENFASDTVDDTYTEPVTQFSNASGSCEDPFQSEDSEENFMRKKREPHIIDKALHYLNRPWIIILAFVGLIGLCASIVTVTYFPRAEVPAKVTAQHGVVSSDNQLCSQIGREILTKGGSAVDAAIGGALCLGVVRPYASGLGGGGYMLIYSTINETSEVIDFREVAPRDSKTILLGETLTENRTPDPMFIAVPGELSGLAKAHEKYGKLPWQDVVLPAAELARDGFIVDKLFAYKIKKYWNLIEQSQNLSSIFGLNGSPITEGSLFKRPDLANTLFEIAYNGPQIFYSGAIAIKMIQDLQNLGSVMKMDDLTRYTSLSRDVQMSFYHGLQILTVPPSSAGGVAVSEIFNILERYNIPREGPTVQSLQRTIEAFKHSFSDITALGDPSFVNTSSTVFLLSEKEYSAKIRRKIVEDHTFQIPYYGIVGAPLADMGSSSLVVVDQERNAVSLTSSLNYPFGSGVYSLSTGVLFNNQMASFTLETIEKSNSTTPSVLSNTWEVRTKTNNIEPYKRPLSSITPTLLLRDGEIYMVIAVSAGTETGQAMITSTVQTILAVAAFEYEPIKAVSKSRYHHQLVPNKVYVEHDFPDSLISGLRQIGHEVEVLEDDSYLGSVQLIVSSDDGLLYAASDPRTNGSPSGY